MPDDHSPTDRTSVASSRPAPSDRRPNVVLVFMDDMTHWAIGTLGEGTVRTPNLDRLVARGTTFTHAVNQGAWTGAVCIPARAMLLTGKNLFEARAAIDAADGDLDRVPLLGEVLGDAGYRTFFTGKWHNADHVLRRSYHAVGPTAGGMLEPRPLVDGSVDIGRPAPGNTWDPTDPAGKGHWLEVEGRVVHSSEHWVDAALGFLSTTTAADPFFLHMALHAPHDPRQAPARWMDFYRPDDVRLPPNLWPAHPFDQGDADCRDELLAPFPRTPEAIRLHRREYYAIVSHADEQIGRLLDALDDRGLSDDTVVVFSGDHGLALGEHGLMGKQSLYDHSVRVPLVFAGPGIPRGRRIDDLVYQASIFPTLCQLLGLPIPESVQFPSVAPAMTDGAPAGDGFVFGAYRHLQRMIRTPRWSLIAYGEARRLQLFDLRSDPWQMRDLSADPGRAGIVRELVTLLRRAQAELGDRNGPWTADIDQTWAGPDRHQADAAAGGEMSPDDSRSARGGRQ